MAGLQDCRMGLQASHALSFDSGVKSCSSAIPPFCNSPRLVVQRDQVRQQLVGAVHTRGKFAPEAKADVDPAAAAILRRHQRAALLALVELEALDERDDVAIP